MELYCNGTLLQWNSTAMELYCSGTLLQWNPTAMELYCNDTLLQWNSTGMELYCNGTLLKWNSTAMELTHCNLSLFISYPPRLDIEVITKCLASKLLKKYVLLLPI